MKQPPRFINPLRPKYVCKLHKALYGLKQAPRAWFQWFNSFLITQSFFHNHLDASLFIHHDSCSSIFVLVYVDDIIINGYDTNAISSFIDNLCSKFDNRKMGDLGFFLGMEIQCTPITISLTQTRYALDLLKNFNMKSCKSSPTPLSSSARLSCLDGDPLSNPSTYWSMVGGLQYLTILSSWHRTCGEPSVSIYASSKHHPPSNC